MAGGETSQGSAVEQLVIPEQYWQAMLDHVQNCFPEEACGLAGGIIDSSARVSEVLLVENMLHSPVRFRMHPAEQLRAFSTLEDHGLELVAIFHSHPTGPEIPSATDVSEFFYPGVISLIFSRSQETGGWRGRGFIIEPGEIREVPLVHDLEK
jgi:[CysO sulfur-carrier protein]-S-L-cysteine hydrolase